MPAQFHVFRGKDGVAIVRPAAVVVQLRGGQACVQVRNFTQEQVTVVFPNPNGNAQTINLPADTPPPGGGHNPNSKNPSLDLGAAGFGIGVYPFHVFVGLDEAQGNSAPTLIIDD